MFIPDFFRKGEDIIDGDKNIANGFNDFFSSIGPELASKIPISSNNFSSFLGEKINSSFIFCQVTPELLIDTAGKLKNKSSYGPDNISSKLLKRILPSITIPLCYLFNLSFQTGYIPIQLTSTNDCTCVAWDNVPSFSIFFLKTLSLISHVVPIMST